MSAYDLIQDLYIDNESFNVIENGKATIAIEGEEINGYNITCNDQAFFIYRYKSRQHNKYVTMGNCWGIVRMNDNKQLTGFKTKKQTIANLFNYLQ